MYIAKLTLVYAIYKLVIPHYTHITLYIGLLIMDTLCYNKYLDRCAHCITFFILNSYTKLHCYYVYTVNP